MTPPKQQPKPEPDERDLPPAQSDDIVGEADEFDERVAGLEDAVASLSERVAGLEQLATSAKAAPAATIPAGADLVECAKHGWRDADGTPCPVCDPEAYTRVQEARKAA